MVDATPTETPTGLAIGDSILGWNRSEGASVPDVINAELGVTIVSPELASGAFAELIDRARHDGTELVVRVGYDSIPREAGAFGCPAAFDALDARYAAVASSRDGVIFVDPSDAVDSTDGSSYDDLIHPSIEGGEAIGRLIADAIRETR